MSLGFSDRSRNGGAGGGQAGAGNGLPYNSTAFPGPFHPDYLRSLGVLIGDPTMQNQQRQQVQRESKRRRLSTDSYESATEPPSSTSSFFPHDNSSSASFSSMGMSMGKRHSINHRRNLSIPIPIIPTRI